MKRLLVLAFALSINTSHWASAKSGCCSHHGGVSGCNEQKHLNTCSDGTLAGPTCKCNMIKAHSMAAGSDKDSMSDKEIRDQCSQFAKPELESQKMCAYVVKEWVLNRARRHALADDLYQCRYDLISKTKPKAEQDKLFEEEFLKMAKEKIVEPGEQ